MVWVAQMAMALAQARGIEICGTAYKSGAPQASAMTGARAAISTTTLC